MTTQTKPTQHGRTSSRTPNSQDVVEGRWILELGEVEEVLVYVWSRATTEKAWWEAYQFIFYNLYSPMWKHKVYGPMFLAVADVAYEHYINFKTPKTSKDSIPFDTTESWLNYLDC